MSEETTTHNLVELSHRLIEAGNRGDFDAMMSFFAPDAVWESLAFGITFEGMAAIRGFLEDWFASYEELWFEHEEVQVLGNGVVFSVVIRKARLVGGGGDVRHRNAIVAVWTDGVILRATMYGDIDEAGAAAERLAASRE
jgi:ketosteroid isomerase-like protein